MITYDGQVINGVFEFEPGITYTAGDIVIYNNKLYYVLDDVSGVNPDNSDKYVEYSLLNAVKDYQDYLNAVNNNELNRPVSLSALDSIIRSYFGGVIGQGYVEILHDVDLNKIKDTGRWFVEVQTAQNIPPTIYFTNNPPELVLLDVYKAKMDTQQNVVDIIVQIVNDYESTQMYSRYYEVQGNYWTPWLPYAINRNINQGVINNITIIQNQINLLQSLYSTISDKINDMMYVIKLAENVNSFIFNHNNSPFNIEVFIVIVSDGPSNYKSYTLLYNLDVNNNDLRVSFNGTETEIVAQQGKTLKTIYGYVFYG